MEFDELLNEARLAIGNRLLTADPWLKRQLKSMLEELDQMDHVRNPGIFMPYYPRGIVDAWNFSEELIELLLALLAAYQKLSSHF